MPFAVVDVNACFQAQASRTAQDQAQEKTAVKSRVFIVLLLFLGVCLGSYYVARAQTGSGIVISQATQDFVNNVTAAITAASNINMNGHSIVNGCISGVCSATAFGATAGIDSTAAIQNGINALPQGGILWLPGASSCYLLSSTLTISKAVVLESDHACIKWSGPASATGMVEFLSGANGGGIVGTQGSYSAASSPWQGFLLDVTGAAGGAMPIITTASGTLNINNLTFKNFAMRVSSTTATYGLHVLATSSVDDNIERLYAFSSNGTKATGWFISIDYPGGGSGGSANGAIIKGNREYGAFTYGIQQANQGQMIGSEIIDNEIGGAVQAYNISCGYGLLFAGNDALDSVPEQNGCVTVFGSGALGNNSSPTIIGYQSEQPNTGGQTGVSDICTASLQGALFENVYLSGDTTGSNYQAATGIMLDAHSSAIVIEGSTFKYFTSAAIDDTAGARLVTTINNTVAGDAPEVIDPGYNVKTHTWRVNSDQGYQLNGSNVIDASGNVFDNTLIENKLSGAPDSAIGAGLCREFVVAGTNPGTCKLEIMCGTSTTPIPIADNIGSGC